MIEIIAKIELVLVSVKACLWKRRFKLMYSEGNCKAHFDSKIKNDLNLSDFEVYCVPNFPEKPYNYSQQGRFPAI